MRTQQSPLLPCPRFKWKIDNRATCLSYIFSQYYTFYASSFQPNDTILTFLKTSAQFPAFANITTTYNEIAPHNIATNTQSIIFQLLSIAEKNEITELLFQDIVTNLAAIVKTVTVTHQRHIFDLLDKQNSNIQTFHRNFPQNSSPLKILVNLFLRFVLLPYTYVSKNLELVASFLTSLMKKQHWLDYLTLSNASQPHLYDVLTYFYRFYYALQQQISSKPNFPQHIKQHSCTVFPYFILSGEQGKHHQQKTLKLYGNCMSAQRNKIHNKLYYFFYLNFIPTKSEETHWHGTIFNHALINDCYMNLSEIPIITLQTVAFNNLIVLSTYELNIISNPAIAASHHKSNAYRYKLPDSNYDMIELKHTAENPGE